VTDPVAVRWVGLVVSQKRGSMGGGEGVEESILNGRGDDVNMQIFRVQRCQRWSVRVTRGEGVVTDESGLMFKVIITIKRFRRTQGRDTKLAERGGGMCDTRDHMAEKGKEETAIGRDVEKV
jgi:hypothetical protein